MNRAALSLAALLASSAASAQLLTADDYVGLAARPDSYSLVRSTIRRGPRAFSGDLVMRIEVSYPYSETQVRSSVRVPVLGERSVLVPVPMLAGASARVSLDGEGAEALLAASAGTNNSPEATYVAVAGLGERVVFDINSASPGGELVVGAVRFGSDPGDVSLPTVASAWGGVHVVIVGSEALLHATPEGRRALAEWVTLGGVMAISPRTTGDLRDPWIASLVGPVEDAEGARRFGRMDVSGVGHASRRWGLGSVVVLPMDLSLATWNANPLAVQQLRGFVAEVRGAGGGVVAPGDLSLFRKTQDSGDVQNVLRPYVNLRPTLIPIAALLTLYIVAVGLMLGKRFGHRAPLKRLVQLPLLALGVLGLVVATSRFARHGGSSARVMALYDMANGSPMAMRRVFAGLTAGGARTFDLPSPDGTLAVFRAGSSVASGTLRWDGARMSIERVRLGLFETGMYYAEGRVEAGEGMTVTVGEGGAPTLVNGTPWRVLEARYDSGERTRVWEFDGVGPGASAASSRSRAYTHGTACDRLWGAERWVRGYARAERLHMERVIFDQMMADPTTGHTDGYLWAWVALPADVGRMMPGFRVEESTALVRVVVPRTSGVQVARSRMGARTYYNEGMGPEPIADVGDAGDASADAEAGQ